MHKLVPLKERVTIYIYIYTSFSTGVSKFPNLKNDEKWWFNKNGASKLATLQVSEDFAEVVASFSEAPNRGRGKPSITPAGHGSSISNH